MKRIEPVDKVCQQLPREEVYKQFRRASKLLLHPKDVPDIKWVEGKETINHENKQGNKGDDNITLCELTEELDLHGKITKSINTVFSTNIVQDIKKEEGADMVCYNLECYHYSLNCSLLKRFTNALYVGLYFRYWGRAEKRLIAWNRKLL